jgi:predicted phosphate transport protein (TIGR00153 family)
MVHKPTLFELIGRSPIRPLQEHIKVVGQCAALLPDLIEAVFAEDQQAVEERSHQVFALEEQADTLKHDLRSHLPKSLFMPIDRRDLLEILDLQDAIADAAQDIAGLMLISNLSLPEVQQELVLKLSHRSLDAVKQADLVINELDELVATGFLGREAETVIKMVGELSQIESETDRMGIDLARAVINLEGEMSPVSILLWLKIIKMIGALADNAEGVGNRLHLLLAR